MANKKQQQVKTKKGKVVKKRSEGFPVLPVAIGLILLGFAAVIGVLAWQSQKSVVAQDRPVNGITCDVAEQVAVHYHARLRMYANGNPMNVSGGVGIDQTQQCLYWLHTHTADGIIHIEAPKGQKDRVFTLGEFFKIWGQPLDAQHVGNRQLQSGETLIAYVDGKVWSGKASDIPLKTHADIVLVIAPPEMTPPSPLSFLAGL